MNDASEPKRLTAAEQLEIYVTNARANKDERLDPDELTARLEGFVSARAARKYFKARGAKVDLADRSLTITTRRVIRRANL